MFDGTYKVDFVDSQVVNGEYLLTSQRINDLLAGRGMPDAADWGRADLTFTFFVPGDLGIKMDMDRLMNTNGVLSSYGDNANDGFSLKARSCDDGRFGPHVANKLDPRFTATLTYICGLGEIDRTVAPSFTPRSDRRRRCSSRCRCRGCGSCRSPSAGR
ncbi:MAG: hypothetical protein HC850_08605 [Rhodomicrobium sp.]|nr:hypothetical protein [Rhodomicrobium sp.]